MKEITSAVVASSLVLLAVFIPVALFAGTTGQLYKQFALTIACAISISLFNALTLTPALSALLLGDARGAPHRLLRRDQPRDRRRRATATMRCLPALRALARGRAGLFALGLVGDVLRLPVDPDRLSAR